MCHDGGRSSYVAGSFKGLWVKAKHVLHAAMRRQKLIDLGEQRFPERGDQAIRSHLGYWGAIGYKFSDRPSRNSRSRCGEISNRRNATRARPNVRISDPVILPDQRVFDKVLHVTSTGYSRANYAKLHFGVQRAVNPGTLGPRLPPLQRQPDRKTSSSPRLSMRRILWDRSLACESFSRPRVPATTSSDRPVLLLPSLSFQQLHAASGRQQPVRAHRRGSNVSLQSPFNSAPSAAAFLLSNAPPSVFFERVKGEPASVTTVSATPRQLRHPRFAPRPHFSGRFIVSHGE